MLFWRLHVRCARQGPLRRLALRLLWRIRVRIAESLHR
jgi:hypothetical protein